MYTSILPLSSPSTDELFGGKYQLLPGITGKYKEKKYKKNFRY